ncbi:hypothetical protein PSHT_15597 [Puccinia striiformis]|uniref:Uncharacterized protein n=1 Tax=Puccinia striiformis TaxID=27350 RepID=A0A2S4UE61_9BASI|nr:hypothetical protein PSHT_15597 [Puccinia striiformis]
MTLWYQPKAKTPTGEVKHITTTEDQEDKVDRKQPQCALLELLGEHGHRRLPPSKELLCPRQTVSGM